MLRRPGATLIEVLVAIFVMGIGLIALLTLFPLGALRMARAIQDDKCAQAAANANAIATMWDIRHDSTVITPGWANSWGSQHPDLFKDALNVVIGGVLIRPLPADPNGPSYPVFADPIGILNSPQGQVQQWLGQGLNSRFTQGIVARSIVSFVPTSQASPSTSSPSPMAQSYKWFTLYDDLIFDTDDQRGGAVSNFNPAGFLPGARRDIRYSWAYMLQRPRSGDASVTNCSIVIYNKRPLGLTQTLGLSEASYGNMRPPYPLSTGDSDRVYFNPDTNTITVIWKLPPGPNVRVGDWLLDCTPVLGPATAANANAATFGSAHAYFYRIVGINEAPNGGSVELEVQQKIRGFPLPVPPNPVETGSGSTTQLFRGTIMILDGIAEVYERGFDRKIN